MTISIAPNSQLDDALAGHTLHCPKCAAHLTSLGLCPICGIRYAIDPVVEAGIDRVALEHLDAIIAGYEQEGIGPLLLAIRAAQKWRQAKTAQDAPGAIQST